MTSKTDYDILLCGGTALTMDPRNPVVENAVIGIKGGRIALLTHRRDVTFPLKAARTILADGRVMTPGLINIHTHTILCMLRGQAEDLGFAPAYTPGVPQGHQVSPEQAGALARLGALEALLFGSTVVNDSHVHADVVIDAMAETGIRAFACSRIHDVDFTKVSSGRWEYDARIGEETLAAGLALAAKYNGKSSLLQGVQLTPHAPDTCSAAFLRKVAAAAEKTGVRVSIHLAQRQKEVEIVQERDGMTPVELLEDVGLLNERLTAAHCIYLSQEDIRRLGRCGATVAHIPRGNAIGGSLAPTSALRRAGARLGLGSDNQHGDMVEVMRWALGIGRIQEGIVSDFWQPRHVVEMATRNGAISLGLEAEIGSLEVGKQADIVVFDFRRAHLTPCLNALGNLVHTCQGRDVEMVLVAGRPVVEDGRATLCDEEKIRGEALAVSRELWEKARREIP